LPHVAARTSGHDAHFDASGFIEPGHWSRAGDLEGSLGAAQTTFAVGDDRELVIQARHPAGGPQFGEGTGEVAGTVGSQTGRLANRSDPPGTSDGCLCVLPCQVGVIIDGTRHHHQVARHPSGVVGGETAQIAQEDVLVEFVAGDVIGQIGPEALARLRIEGPTRVSRAR